MYNTEVISKWKEHYEKIRPIIDKRLQEFKNIWKNASDERLFAEFVFCHLTPQSKAKVCWSAVLCLRDKHLLIDGSEEEVKNCLVGVRFKNNKAKYIVRSRELFWYYPGGFRKFLKDIGIESDVFRARNYLVEHVKGMGYKEASHFLRNIGFGENIAILDRHILKNLKRVGAISQIPSTLSRKRYLEIEETMRNLSHYIEIPMDHLDLLLWYLEAGEVFK